MSRGFAGLHSPPLAPPCVLPEGILQRRIGDSSGVVCDRRCRHDGDDFQDLFLRETSSDERIKFLLSQVPALFDEGFCQCGERCKSLVRGQAPLTNCGCLFRTDSLLESQRRVEGTAYVLEFVTASVSRTI